MAMSPRKMMAMGKGANGKMKSAVKLRGGGMVKKMQAGGSVSKEQEEMGDRPRGGNMAKKSSSKKAGNGMTESPRPVPRPYTMEDREAVIRGNRAAARGLRMGGMVKK